MMACRNAEKAQAAAAEIEASGPSGTVELLELDLADLDSIARAAERFLAEHDRLDVLVNNAGLMALPYQKTAQGFEMQIGVNHLGHFALDRPPDRAPGGRPRGRGSCRSAARATGRARSTSTI